MEYLVKREQRDNEVEIVDPKVSEERSRGDFRNFPISESSVRNLTSKGIGYLFPIQVETFGPIYAGKDLIGRDRTGSGKTLAFALPILEKMRQKGDRLRNAGGQKPYVLCLVPTRELAIQVHREFERFKNTPNEYRTVLLYGGSDIGAQMRNLQRGAEIVIGTPGRVIDLFQRRVISAAKLDHLILDETDQMLNIGFQEDIEKILGHINSHFQEEGRPFSEIQFLLFSATIPKFVENISNKFMKRDQVFVDMIKNTEVRTSTTVEHLSVSVYSMEEKIQALNNILLAYGGQNCRTIIFTERKCDANQIKYQGVIRVECQVLHGDIPQRQREMTFQAFRSGRLKCLIATDVAARGLDVPEVDLVIQLSPPNVAETYIHRSGRTGRAGKKGVCVTFYTRKEENLMYKIEHETKMRFKRINVPKGNEGLNSLAARNGKVNGPRSLINGSEGFVTYLMESERPAQSPNDFRDALSSYLMASVLNSIRNVTMQPSRRGVMFDVPVDLVGVFDKSIAAFRNPEFSISVPKNLPSDNQAMPTNRENHQYRHCDDSTRASNSERGERFSAWNAKTEPSDLAIVNQMTNGVGVDSSAWENLNKSLNDNRLAWNSDDKRGMETRDHRIDFGGSSDRPTRVSTGERDDFKLFIGNLAFDTTEKDLQKVISDLGMDYDDCYLVKNSDKSSKGFGYVKFATIQDASSAYESLRGMRVGSRQIRIDYATKRTN